MRWCKPRKGLELMSTWREGRTYNYYGTAIVCVRRWFEGPMEMVELKPPDAVTADGTVVSFTSCIRTACTLAPCVVPKVTETLGGVCRPDACHHKWYPTVRANAGPNEGRVCCTSCGAPVEGNV